MSEGFMNWIKCSERMPEDGVVVLTECGGHLNVGVGNRSGSNYRYITSAINNRELTVTHWIDFDDIPMPQPPEG